jgi:hypothetical protein
LARSVNRSKGYKVFLLDYDGIGWGQHLLESVWDTSRYLAPNITNNSTGGIPLPEAQ